MRFRSIHWVFLLKWIVANTAGFALGVILSGSVTKIQYLHNSQLGQAILGSTLFGVAMGAAQWMALQERIPRAGLWFLASILGFSIGFPLALTVGNVFHFTEGLPAEKMFRVLILIGAIVGLVVGTWQALVLRRHVKHASLWIIVCSVGMSSGLAAWAAVSIRTYQTMAQPITNLLSVALIFSLITGVSLEIMLNRPAYEQTSNQINV
jgi:hypothetical protein